MTQAMPTSLPLVRAPMAALALIVASLSGCMPVPGGGGPRPDGPTTTGPVSRERIGTFTVVHRPVSVKDALGERAVVPGDALYNDSKVTTGPGGGARIEIPGYGALELDERTDPFFEKAGQGACVLVRILYGLVYATGSNFCVDLPPDGADFVLNSSANIRVSSSTAVVTVLDGSARFRRLRLPPLTAGQQATITTGKTPQIVQLSPAQLRAVTAWRQRFQTIR